MPPRVVTFGEIMLRLSPPGFERFFQSPTLSATFGGGEANVAISLAQFGLQSVFVSALPAHAIGDAAIRTLRAEGVDTSRIVRSADRVGIYFAESGASQRASTVIYDRAHSAISRMTADAVDWSAVMAGAAWFHVTGYHTGPRRLRRHRHRGRSGRRQACGRARQRRSQLPQEAVVGVRRRRRRCGR